MFSLYSLDPSGTYVQCDAKAIGSGAEGAQSSLGEIYHKDISLKDATKHALTILKQVQKQVLQYCSYSFSERLFPNFQDFFNFQKFHFPPKN